MSDNQALHECRIAQDQKFIDSQRHSTKMHILSLGIVITIFIAVTGLMSVKLDAIEKLGVETATKVEMILQNGGAKK